VRSRSHQRHHERSAIALLFGAELILGAITRRDRITLASSLRVARGGRAGGWRARCGAAGGKEDGARKYLDR